jgi:hypothetical protein
VSSKPIVFKLAGGATAQLLGLMIALKIKKEYGKSYRFKYYPYSTGTYWPFEIDFLIEESELVEVWGKTKGVDPNQSYMPGKIIESHPLQRKLFSYEKLLMIVRQAHLEFPLRYFFQRELALEANSRRINLARTRIRAVSGGFYPILDHDVFEELDKRFKIAGKHSPFSRKANFGSYTCIHYRLGDKRTNFSTKFNDHDGVMNPKTFRRILERIDPELKQRVFVVSDEPTIARNLLIDEGISAELFGNHGDIWTDVFNLSQASIFIGSWSQVSQLAAACVIHNGGTSFLPKTSNSARGLKWNVDGLKFFDPEFLGPSHPIYH